MTEREAEELSPLADSEGEISLEEIPLHSTNLISVLDEEGGIRYQSPSIEHILGYRQEDLVGRHCTECFHPEDRERVLRAFRRIVASEERTVEAIEYRHTKVDGSYCWVESVGSADPTSDGYYVINTRDVSDRKKRDDLLRQKNKRLEEFAQVVSHDLRNPLSIASMSLKMVRGECESEHLDDIDRAHKRMDSLINDLLVLSRSGNPLDETEMISLELLSRTCWETIVTGDATIQIEVDRHIKADKARLKQLLENLLRNAVEHGGRNVTVRIGELADTTGFFVEDTGSGVADDLRDRIFTSGFSTHRDGTGIGLSIVHDVAGAHGWEITVTEGEGGGARFEFENVELF